MRKNSQTIWDRYDSQTSDTLILSFINIFNHFLPRLIYLSIDLLPYLHPHRVLACLICILPLLLINSTRGTTRMRRNFLWEEQKYWREKNEPSRLPDILWWCFFRPKVVFSDFLPDILIQNACLPVTETHLLLTNQPENYWIYTIMYDKPGQIPIHDW